MSLIEEIRTAVQQTELFITLHAQQRMTARHIPIADVRKALLSKSAEVIEDYPGDPRGPSCLVYGKAAGRALHIHVSHPPEVALITVYEPDVTKWKADLRTRKGEGDN